MVTLPEGFDMVSWRETGRVAGRSKYFRFNHGAVTFVYESPDRHSRERGNPGPFVRERLKSLDSRLRGNDEVEESY
ncbi:hypothetical protein [Lysobacter gummosus]|uniref:hypothetical protein n=1 Tax=Lysobacter gummosus TaxID=262324 RepID=UPI00362688FB